MMIKYRGHIIKRWKSPKTSKVFFEVITDSGIMGIPQIINSASGMKEAKQFIEYRLRNQGA